mmetsp:Transcript_32171/g.84984  ORF Transcript_32171/g.84984 Transcript_32171/m.84984 type:complete len:207 (-) Transcript_32171:278-898(-)
MSSCFCSELDGLAIGGSAVVLANLLPIDDVPERADVLGPAVLVLEVIGVLPHVEAHDGDQAGIVHERVVLVGRRHNLDRAILGDREPRPARAEDARGGGGERGLELVVRPEGRRDLLRQHAGRLATGVGAHDRPEEAVVVVAAAGIVELGRLRTAHQRRERGGVLAGHRLVEVVDVRLVVEVVVELHGGRIDVWLERAVVIRKRGE